MCTTLQINLADAVKAYQGADAAGKKLLSNLFPKADFNQNVMDRVETFEDVLAAAGMTPEQFADSCQGLTTDEVAYTQLKLIAEVLNEGWQADWNNSNQVKYYPYFNMKGAF